MEPRAEIFGAAYDGLDDPLRVGLKVAYLQARREKRLPPFLPRDPYDAIAPLAVERVGGRIRPAGKVKVPGWVCPRPRPADLPRLRPEKFREFMDAGGPQNLARKCRSFTERILPRIPVLVGVDHALATGPITALSQTYGAADLLVVVLDAHFDALPAAVRAPSGRNFGWKSEALCGAFLAGLLKEGVIMPENLLVVGVNDFPPEEMRETPYGRAYFSLLRSGVRVIPRPTVEGEDFPARLKEELRASSGRAIYVSLDADVAAGRGFNAVRFMDWEGIPAARVLETGRLIREEVGSGRYMLAGLDVSEVDVHFLGLPDPEGGEDRTAELCAEFIAAVV